MSKTARKKQTITFQPTEIVKSLLNKASTARLGVPRSRLINDALQGALASMSGKRELPKG